MEDLSRFCCQDERCLAFGSRGAGNLSVCGHVDKAKRIRLLYCCCCKKRFTERKGTVFYRAHLPTAKVASILQHVQDGNGMRQTARLCRTKEDTVIRYARKAGRHARSLHGELLAVSPSHPRAAARREVGLVPQEAAPLHGRGAGARTGR